MGKICGRPMKYLYIIESLQDNELYTASAIAAFADGNGLLFPDMGYHPQQRVRVAMNRLSNYHTFPDNGDGFIYRTGQRPVPGWFGWRWKLLTLEGNH